MEGKLRLIWRTRVTKLSFNYFLTNMWSMIVHKDSWNTFLLFRDKIIWKLNQRTSELTWATIFMCMTQNIGKISVLCGLINGCFHQLDSTENDLWSPSYTVFLTINKVWTLSVWGHTHDNGVYVRDIGELKSLRDKWAWFGLQLRALTFHGIDVACTQIWDSSKALRQYFSFFWKCRALLILPWCSHPKLGSFIKW